MGAFEFQTASQAKALAMATGRNVKRGLRYQSATVGRWLLIQNLWLVINECSMVGEKTTLSNLLSTAAGPVAELPSSRRWGVA